MSCAIEKYAPLFQPINIGNLTLKNRFVMAPMSVHMTHDGSVTDEEIAYYIDRAKGGAAMLTLGSVCINPDGDFGGQVYINNDECIPGLKRLTSAVHENGALISAQLHHSGRETNERTSGYQPVAPSYFEPEVYSVFKAEYDPPRVLTNKECWDYIEKYAQGARRAKEAGFDAIEFHCAHGYLICAFMSPLTNKRTDEFGGSFPARMKFVTEIMKRTRELVGEDFPIICRIVGDELRAGGIDMAMSVKIAQYLESLGVNALSVSCGMYPYERTVMNMTFKRGVNVYLAQNVKEAVNIPVFAAGQLNRPDVQLDVLQKGKADVICIGRGLIADPNYPNKLQAGKLDEITYCLACNKGCHDRTASDRYVHCTMNPRTGRETTLSIEPAKTAKKVMIVGGGAAGIQAATICKERGIDATIYEKTNELGGRLILASMPPEKRGYVEALEQLTSRVDRLGLKVVYNTEVTPELVEKEAPDAVIIATGSNTIVPTFVKGYDQDFVTLADPVLRGWKKLGKKVVVCGGGAVGAETARLLLEEEKREVYLIEMLDGIGKDMPQDSRINLHKEYDYDLDFHPILNAKVLEFGDHTVVAENLLTGEIITIDGVTDVVAAFGARGNQELYKALQGKVKELYIVGDAERAKDLTKAIWQATEAANSL